MGNRMTPPNRLNRFQSQPIIDIISICSQIRRVMVQAGTASLFFFVKYDLYVQCPLIEMMRRCPSTPRRRDTTYDSRGARRSRLDDLTTSPGTGVEVRSAPA